MLVEVGDEGGGRGCTTLSDEEGDEEERVWDKHA